LGDVALRTDPKTPLQNFDVPLLDGGVEGLKQFAGAADEALGLLQGIKKDEDDANALDLERKMITFAQDERAAYKTPLASGPVDEDGKSTFGSDRSALGKAANKEWFTDQMGRIKTHMDGLRSSSEYQGLGQAAQNAVDQSIQGKELKFRNEALMHWREQARLNKTANIEASATVAGNEAVANAPSPELAHDSLTRLFSHMNAGFNHANGTTLKEPANKLVAQRALDQVANTSIENLLQTDQPGRVAQAEAWLLENNKVTHNFLDGTSVDIRLTPNVVKDLQNKIRKTGEGELARKVGNDLFKLHQDDSIAARAEIEKNAAGYSTEVIENAFAQYESRRSNTTNANDRLDQDQYDAASRYVQKNFKLPDASAMDRLTGGEVSTLKALLKEAEQDKMLGEDHPSNYGVVIRLAGLTETELRGYSQAEFIKDIAMHLNKKDGTRERAMDEWTSAQNSGSQAVALRAGKDTRARIKAQALLVRNAYTDGTKYFTAQAKRSAAIRFKGSGATVSAKRANFVLQAEREWTQSHSRDQPLSNDQANKMLARLNSQVYFDGENVSLFELLPQITDEDGDPILGPDAINKAFDFVAPEMRFELIEAYRKERSKTKGNVEAEMAQPIPASALRGYYKKLVLDNPYSSIKPAARKFIIDKLTRGTNKPSTAQVEHYYVNNLLMQAVR
jgi:hypothetical protein